MGCGDVPILFGSFLRVQFLHELVFIQKAATVSGQELLVITVNLATQQPNVWPQHQCEREISKEEFSALHFVLDISREQKVSFFSDTLIHFFGLTPLHCSFHIPPC